MQLMLPNDVVLTMRQQLFRAGRREIGGMVMGEDLGNQRFRVLEFSVDTYSGTRTSFHRDSEEHDRALSAFFEKTGSDYARFNYLGEWHSHPCFSVQPSLQDLHAMQDLVDGTGGVNFAILFISRLKWYCRFDCSAHLFVQGHAPTVAVVVRENRSITKELS